MHYAIILLFNIKLSAKQASVVIFIEEGGENDNDSYLSDLVLIAV